MIHGNGRIDQIAPKRSQPCQCPILVGTSKPTVSDHIRHQYRREFPGFGHGVPPEAVDLNPLDVISFPPGAIRRFENVQPAASGEDAVLMFVIGGNAPKAEFTDKAMKELEELGVWPGK